MSGNRVSGSPLAWLTARIVFFFFFFFDDQACDGGGDPAMIWGGGGWGSCCHARLFAQLRQIPCQPTGSCPPPPTPSTEHAAPFEPNSAAIIRVPPPPATSQLESTCHRRGPRRKGSYVYTAQVEHTASLEPARVLQKSKKKKKKKKN
ncbi:hypothetical protein FN846DRAFT_656284 [Sphaerosporella brunnea]|uniref:Secreted protein n=1 Tax=Sphaerosporella brunnea TaxID=1250544 RepID=A0A5J5EBL5_9PEZI|nr:hypothetical protein FN846DRAFT_656284 [Sphaerosporella brunnea]